MDHIKTKHYFILSVSISLNWVIKCVCMSYAYSCLPLVNVSLSIKQITWKLICYQSISIVVLKEWQLKKKYVSLWSNSDQNGNRKKKTIILKVSFTGICLVYGAPLVIFTVGVAPNMKQALVVSV